MTRQEAEQLLAAVAAEAARKAELFGTEIRVSPWPPRDMIVGTDRHGNVVAVIRTAVE